MFIAMQIMYNIPKEYFRVSVEVLQPNFRVSIDTLKFPGYLQIP